MNEKYVCLSLRGLVPRFFFVTEESSSCSWDSCPIAQWTLLLWHGCSGQLLRTVWYFALYAPCATHLRATTFASNGQHSLAQSYTRSKLFFAQTHTVRRMEEWFGEKQDWMRPKHVRNIMICDKQVARMHSKWQIHVVVWIWHVSTCCVLLLRCISFHPAQIEKSCISSLNQTGSVDIKNSRTVTFRSSSVG